MNLFRSLRTELERSRLVLGSKQERPWDCDYIKAAQDIQQKVEDAIVEPADCVVGGCCLEESIGPNFLEATVLVNVSTDSNIWKTEPLDPW
jgi:hypothetical protein